MVPAQSECCPGSTGWSEPNIGLAVSHFEGGDRLLAGLGMVAAMTREAMDDSITKSWPVGMTIISS